MSSLLPLPLAGEGRSGGATSAGVRGFPPPGASRHPPPPAGEGSKSAATSLPLGPRDAFQDQLVRVFGATPAQHFDPFAGLEILVVLEEVLDLLQRDLGQVAVGLHLVV